MSYEYSLLGWYTGEGSGPRSTDEAPPTLNVAETPGVPRARWRGYAWAVEPYPETASPVAYAYDVIGWYTGTAAVGTASSTRAKPDVLYTGTTADVVRARFVGGVWRLQPFRVERFITRRAFSDRFTPSEEIDIAEAAVDSPVRSLAASIRALRQKVTDSLFVDLDLTVTRDSVILLETEGILGAGRALEILDGAIADDERYVPT